MKKKLFSVFLILSVLAFYSCAEDDGFSSDQNLTLNFSSEKISFDTIFTTIGSATKKFKIYNWNDKSLLIETIELMNPGKSGFRINIDGEKGAKLANVEILKRDSLFGFVEVTVDPYDSKNPLVIRDSIRFVTNGNAQYLYLEAVGQDVFIWNKKTITEDTLITSLKPILVYDTVTVAKGAKLTIEQGVVFYLNKDAAISLHGTILAKGSVEEPIVFRGDRFDNIEGDIPYNNVPGQWGGIVVHTSSYDNSFQNVHIRNAVRGITFHASNPERKKAELKNTIVFNSLDYGVYSKNSNLEVVNCLFANAKNGTLILEGGKYSFLHCTIANYYEWGVRRTASVVLRNQTLSGDDSPLSKCDFLNTIVYGDMSDEVSVEKTGSALLKFRFDNCLIKGKLQEGESFAGNIWNQDPLFDNLNKDKVYSYSFELQQNSPAIDKGNNVFSASVPMDIKGYSRLQDANPDIGCYEWHQ